MSQFSDVDRIVAKARAMQAAHEVCEANGGHWYSVDGFSAIAHPETGWPLFQRPKVNSLSDIVFKAYVCRDCGRRVSVEEGREYMSHHAAGITPEMEPWYRTDG